MKYVLIFLFFVAIEVMLRSEQQYKINVAETKCDSLKKANDSIYDELMPQALELNRYQMGYQIFARKHPKEAAIYSNIISNETE
jgi:hypothetical protein